MTDENKDLKLAVLIDAENVPSHHVKAMLEEITKYGVPTTKRIYGDWTKPQITGWKGVLLENAITPIQQYSYTSGKNSSDSAMIIDAMDLLYSGKVDGFCIVSSDSDFTRLAIRLRESGMKVIGIGEKKTPNPFITACDKFIFLEILSAQYETAPAEETKSGTFKPVRKSLQSVDRETINLISSTINDLADEDGWAFLGDVGGLINKKKPEFDPRNYGFTKLTPMLKALSKNFEIDERRTEKSNVRLVFIRIRKLIAEKHISVDKQLNPDKSADKQITPVGAVAPPSAPRRPATRKPTTRKPAAPKTVARPTEAIPVPASQTEMAIPPARSSDSAPPAQGNPVVAPPAARPSSTWTPVTGKPAPVTPGTVSPGAAAPAEGSGETKKAVKSGASKPSTRKPPGRKPAARNSNDRNPS